MCTATPGCRSFNRRGACLGGGTPPGFRGLLRLSCLALILVAGCERMPEQRGVALGLFSEDPDWSYRTFLQEIAAVGATHVALVVPWYVDDAAGVRIGPHPRFTAPERVIRRTTLEARALGLEVTLFPIVRITNPSPGDWRGNLHPASKPAFFASYTSFIETFARLGSELSIPRLVVGSELSTLDTDRSTWAEIIRGVRRVAPSTKVLYSANWDHYREVPFWDLVDEIGVSGYFELDPENKHPTLEGLTSAWRRDRMELEALARRWGKPLVLTEVGYLSQHGTHAWPWKEEADEPLDLEAQRLCFEATRNAWRGSKALGGLYIWNWFGWGGPQSKEYTPRGKPASEVIRAWFGGRASLFTDFRTSQP